jgi:cell wall-associated NlpC family hydrolase
MVLEKLFMLLRRARYESVKYSNSALSITRAHGKRTVCVAIAIAMALLISTIAVGVINSYAYAVVLNGKTVGYVNNKAEYNKLVDDIKQELTAEDVNVNEIFNEIEIKSTPTDTLKNEVEMLDEPTLKEKLIEKSSVYASGYEILIGNEVLGVVALATDGKLIEQKIKDRFGMADGETLVKEELSGVLAAGKVQTELSKLVSTDYIVEKILKGRDEVKLYTATADDTLWDIAVKNGLTEADVLNANPNIDPRYLHEGDQVKLNKANPYLAYTTVSKATTTEVQPYNVIEKETSSLYVGQTKVEKEGVEGQRRVEREYTKVNGEVVNAVELSSETLSAPIDKVVLKGTKRAPAKKQPSYNYTPAQTGDASFDTLLNFARAQLGKPYRGGAAGPNAFDCSGFVTYVMNQSGYAHFSRGSSASMYSRFQRISAGEARGGDLVFFSGTVGGRGGITHVGLYIGGGMMIHAAPRGIAYDNINSGYYRSHLAGFARVK